jgi:hypothetical protein
MAHQIVIAPPGAIPTGKGGKVMDLFILDKLIINSVKTLMNDGVLQFTILVAVWIVSEIALPSRKTKEQKK